jgi:phosphoenolpyruvate-protein phosphotransferase
MPYPELRLIRQISDIITGSSDYHKGLSQALECLGRKLKVDACSILSYDEAGSELVMAATYGYESETIGKLRFPPERGITGYCFRTGEVVNVDNMREHPAFWQFPSERGTEYHGLLCVPLVAGGHKIGVLNLSICKAEHLPAETQSLVQTLVAPLSVFLRNAQLSERVSEKTRTSRNAAKAPVNLRGVPITEGVVQGQAYFLIGNESFEHIKVEHADNAASEKAKFSKALKVAREDTVALQDEAGQILAEADAAIFYAHMVLLDDQALIDKVKAALDEGFALRFALKYVYDEFERELGLLNNDLVTERLADLKDVILRIYQAVDEVEGVTSRPRQPRFRKKKTPIVITNELLPSQLIRLPLKQLAGIVCEKGGTTSHVAILAKALRIPMLVGVENATKTIQKSDDLILDCHTGLCFVRPTAEMARHFRDALAYHHHTVKHEPVEAKEALTTDGQAIRLGGNVSLVNEVPLLKRYGAMGTGLYRTEFMFMIRTVAPSEDEQYKLYRQVVEASEGHSCTIRLFDVGGDKPPAYMDIGKEANPALGYRGARFLLSNPEFLQPHLRAILRTTVHGRVNILVPMVADLEDVVEMQRALNEATKALDEAGIHYRNDFRFGVMLEVPSAFWALPAMLPHIDFVSIGTNDLVQYTFAVDRTNSRVNRWYRQFHPVILRMIKDTCAMVSEYPGKSVSICGELAGNPLGVPFVIGCGVKYLSMSPARIPTVRAVIEQIPMSACEELVQNAVACHMDGEIVKMMHDFAHAHDLADICQDSVDRDSEGVLATGTVTGG